MTNPDKFSLFRRKVQNQVFGIQRIPSKLQYYAFDGMNHSNYTFLNHLFTDISKKNESISSSLVFYGPENYSWKDDRKYYLFIPTGRHNLKPIFVLPLKWLLRYDPNIPICGRGCPPCYLDLEKQKCIWSLAYLIGERFYLYEIYDTIDTQYPSPGDPKPYSIGKCDEDWCITHVNAYTSYMPNITFLSFLLIKNMDFSELDAKVEAKVEAKGLRFKCPVRCDGSVKVKDNSRFIIVLYHFLTDPRIPCFCVDCRKAYRAIEVGVFITETSIMLQLIDPIK